VFGPGAAFFSAGGYHHHIAVNTWESLGGSPAPPGATGLYHTARYPGRAALAAVPHRILAAHVAVEGAADHGVSESVYLRDPDENGVELYRDKPKDVWRRDPAGNLAVYTKPLDLHKLLSEAPSGLHLCPGPRDL
jgi:catechol 2,3-dioxygenase